MVFDVDITAHFSIFTSLECFRFVLTSFVYRDKFKLFSEFSCRYWSWVYRFSSFFAEAISTIYLYIYWVGEGSSFTFRLSILIKLLELQWWLIPFLTLDVLCVFMLMIFFIHHILFTFTMLYFLIFFTVPFSLLFPCFSLFSYNSAISVTFYNIFIVLFFIQFHSYIFFYADKSAAIFLFTYNLPVSGNRALCMLVSFIVRRPIDFNPFCLVSCISLSIPPRCLFLLSGFCYLI